MAYVCGSKKAKRNEKSKEMLIYLGKEEGCVIPPCCTTKYSIRRCGRGCKALFLLSGHAPKYCCAGGVKAQNLC